MRVTNANALGRSLETIQQRQQGLIEAQDRLTSGKKIARASDDPTGAARVERALAQEARAVASQRGLETSRNAMVQAETALGQADDLMQRARELVVQAGNPSYNNTQRKALAQEISGLRDQLVQVANRGDGAGGWLFAGQGASQPPFVDAPGGVQFRGTPGSLLTASGEPLPMTSDGESAFLRGNTGNGVFVTAPSSGNGGQAWISAGSVVDPSAVTGDNYSILFTDSGAGMTYAVLRNGAPTPMTAEPYVAGQAIQFDGLSMNVHGAAGHGDQFDVKPSARELSVFNVLDQVVTGLRDSSATAAQVTQAVQTGLRDIDAAGSNLTAERARLGEVLNRTDAVEGRLASSKLLAQTERSLAEDLNMVEAVSEFSNRQTSYDAALKAYSIVQKLSLFEYIG